MVEGRSYGSSRKCSYFQLKTIEKKLKPKQKIKKNC